MTMKNIIFTICLVIFSLNSVGALKSAGKLSSSLTGKTFSASLQEGFHFNEKAPNAIHGGDTEILPTKTDKRSIQFSLSSKNQKINPQSATAHLFVCDDANTYCETHRIALTQTKQPQLAEKKMTGDELQTHEDFNKALKKAKKENKIVLLDFSARWCPGCVRYEKEVFVKPEFQKLKTEVVFLKIDVDLFKNFALTEKFKIQGIPTMIAVNSKGQEIDRFVDFKPWEELQNFAASAKQDAHLAGDILKIAESADEKTKLQIGRKLLAMDRYSESITVFAQMKQPPPEIWSAKVSAAKKQFKENAENKSNYINTLKQAIDSEPKGTRSLAWRTQLIPFLPEGSEEAKKVLSEGKKTVQLLLTDEAQLKQAMQTESPGEFLGFEKMLVAQLGVDLLDEAKSSEAELAKMWDQAVSVSQSYEISPNQEGPALRYLIFLSAAKKYELAEKWADQLIAQHPGNLDLPRRKMRILLGLNKPDEAIKTGEAILSQSEGRNQFWVAESLAKAYLAAKKNLDAKKLLQAYLAREEMQSEKMKSTRTSFEKLLEESSKN